MREKPSYRELDDQPKRGDDIKLVLPWGWGSYEGSGRLFVVLLISLGLLFMSVISSALNVWHDRRVAEDHVNLAREIRLNTYVTSLSEEQRRELDLQEPEEIRKMRRER